MSSSGKFQGSHWKYWLIRNALFIAYLPLFRFRVTGHQNIPAESDPRGVILAPNHESYLDPPLIGVSVGRRVTFLAKEYLFKNGIVGWVLRSIGAYPVHSDNGNDIRSIRDVVRLLKGGQCITVFPEGTRSQDGNLQKAQGGIGFLALKSGAWVVPAYIEGTFEVMARDSKSFRPRRISIVYGKAFVPAEDPAILSAPDPNQAVGDKILEEIKSLKEKSFPDPTRQSA